MKRGDEKAEHGELVQPCNKVRVRRGIDDEIDRYIDAQSEMDEGEERNIGCADHQRGLGNGGDGHTLWSGLAGSARHPLDNGL